MTVQNHRTTVLHPKLLGPDMCRNSKFLGIKEGHWVNFPCIMYRPQRGLGAYSSVSRLPGTPQSTFSNNSTFCPPDNDRCFLSCISPLPTGVSLTLFGHFYSAVKPKGSKLYKKRNNTGKQRRLVRLLRPLEHDWRLTPPFWVASVKTSHFQSLRDCGPVLPKCQANVFVFWWPLTVINWHRCPVSRVAPNSQQARVCLLEKCLASRKKFDICLTWWS